MNIVVLGGGNSPERDVSLRSAKAVANAAREAGFTVQEYDPADGIEFLTQVPKDTIVLPILHGAGGEDGEIQQTLEQLGLPYLGTESAQSRICFSKASTRQLLQQDGLPIASGATVTATTYPSNEIANGPHVLKISEGGSSIGTYIVRDPAHTDPQKIQAVFALGAEAVIEELVQGVEITVPVLDSTVMTVIEVQPPESQEFDYENKYNGATKELIPPESIDAETQKRAQELALQCHSLLGCRHLSRTDMIVPPSGDIVILETNTMPGMTEQSFFPLVANYEGMGMQGLVTKFVDMVKRDYGLQK